MTKPKLNSYSALRLLALLEERPGRWVSPERVLVHHKLARTTQNLRLVAAAAQELLRYYPRRFLLHDGQMMLKPKQELRPPLSPYARAPEQRGALLSRREQALVDVLKSAEGRPVERAEILARVWGPEERPRYASQVDVLIRQVRTKLGPSSVVTHPQGGFCWANRRHMTESVERWLDWPEMSEPARLTGKEALLYQSLWEQRGRPVLRKDLVAAVWPGRPPRAAGALDVLMLQFERHLPGVVAKLPGWGTGWMLPADAPPMKTGLQLKVERGLAEREEGG